MQEKVTALSGNEYNINTGIQLLQPESCLVVQIMNPEDSNRTVYLSYLAISSKHKEISLEIIEDGVVLAYCQSLFPRNPFGFLPESKIKACYALQNGNPVIGGNRLKRFERKSGVLQIEFYERIQVVPGHTLAFCLRNPFSEVNRYTVNICWIEG